ncbi:MAG: MATE family efflux transporter [Oscillospiraceae bacterium]|nr:MATE family efflux transporter [Oscillospiraceae bacterium]
MEPIFLESRDQVAEFALGSKEERRSFYKSVFFLVLPMALQNLINVAVTSADVLMLGSVGETVLSASSLAGQVQFVMTLIFFGLTSGAAVLTAQYWGKGDTKTIEKVIGIAMRFSILVAFLFTVVVELFPYQVMSIFTAEQPVIEEGVKYLQIVAVSYLLTSVTMVYLNIMRSVEKVVISTIVYLCSLLCNIGVNAVLIFGLLGCPKLGIQGAAIGTVIARTLELAITLVYSRKKSNPVRLHFKNLFVRNKILFRDFFRFSIPVTLNELMWGLGVSMNSVIIGHLGSPVVAANSVAQVTRQLATVVAFGIANATAILIGKAIGGNLYDKARLYAKRFLRLTLIFGGIGALIVLGVAPVVLALMNLSAEAQGYLVIMMGVMSYFVFGQAINTTMIVGIFRAGGDTKFGLFLDVSTMWGGSILLGALCAFVFHWSIPWVYVVLMSDEIIKLPFTIWRYKSQKWLRNVTRDF